MAGAFRLGKPRGGSVLGAGDLEADAQLQVLALVAHGVGHGVGGLVGAAVARVQRAEVDRGREGAERGVRQVAVDAHRVLGTVDGVDRAGVRRRDAGRADVRDGDLQRRGARVLDGAAGDAAVPGVDRAEVQDAGGAVAGIGKVDGGVAGLGHRGGRLGVSEPGARGVGGQGEAGEAEDGSGHDPEDLARTTRGCAHEVGHSQSAQRA